MNLLASLEGTRTTLKSTRNRPRIGLYYNPVATNGLSNTVEQS